MRGDQIKATWGHDRGAYGRCSYCGRYSDHPAVLCVLSCEIKCDCGKYDGWSGSFKIPDDSSIWSETNLIRF